MTTRFSLFLCATAIGLAQSTSIQGLVQDESQAVIPGATVTVTNVATGVTQKAEVNQQGFYSVPFQTAGTYTVRAEKAGFSAVTRENVKLDVGQSARVDFTLRVGGVAQTVEVSAGAALLDSESSTVGAVIDNKRIVEMPLNKRNYLELARLIPGVLPASTLNNGSRTGNTEAGVVAMGMRGYQTNILLDGVDNSSRSGGGPLGFQAQATKPSVDAVAEFRVVTNNFSAEYGYRMGPKVMVSIKSGTNQLHGSLYEFLRNDKFDGANFFANRSGSRKPPYRQNQAGGTIGGPVFRDKTFYFFSYEATRIRLGRSLLSTVPSSGALTGDFSRERLNNRDIYDPLTTVGDGASAIRSPFPGNVIPRTRFDLVAVGLLPLFPGSNVAGREFQENNYFRAPSNIDDTNQIDFKIDHNFSARDRVFFRYSIRRQDTVTASPLPAEAGGTGGETVKLPGDNFAFGWTRSLTPSIFNDFRFGFTDFPTKFDILLTQPLNEKYGIRNSPGDTFNDGLNHGFAQMNIAGYAALGTPCCWPNTNILQNIHLADNVLIQRGKHSLKGGFEFRRATLFREASRFRRGQFTFSKVYTAQSPNVAASRNATGNGMADFLLGLASQTTVGNPFGEDAVSWSWGGYFQDDWKILPKLTLNLGLRWDLFQGAYFPNGMPVGRGGVSMYLTEYSGVPRGDARYGTFLRPSSPRDCGCQNDFNNFAPRFGFAYQLSSKTVIRSGAGIFFADGDAGFTSVFLNQTPDASEVVIDGTNTAQAAMLRNGFPLVRLPAAAPVRNSSVNTRVPKLRAQYSTQWFFDIQRELPLGSVLTVGYQASKSTNLFLSRNLNYPGPHPTIPAAQRRLDPQWNGIGLSEPGANSNYNALTVRGEKRFSRGLTFITAYTWSHNIDHNTQSLDTNFDSPANPDNLTAERGNANLDHRHVFTTSATYELPFGRGKSIGSGWSGPVSVVLGGWQLGGILTLRSGFPFDITYPGDPQNSGTRNRGNRIASGNIENPTIDRWFDQNAFVQSAPGVYGNAGRNLLVGPGTRNFDLTLAKRFQMPWEGHSLQFRFESFNFTNTPKFGQPNSTLRGPATATINIADEPRRIQFGLKYLF